jgi:hypothetical protein
MANLVEVNEFTAGIFQLEVTTPALGGPGGPMNSQAQSLANRTLYLKTALEAEVANRTAADAAHVAAADPHAQYLKEADAATTYEAIGAAAAEMAAHVASSDPHPGYLTPAEGNAAYDAIGAATGAVAAHEAAGDPHPQYLTQAEADALYDPLGGGGTPNAVTSTGNIADNVLVRGDGGAKVVQQTGISVSDNDELFGYKGLLNVQTGTTYTVVAADTGKIVDHANVAAIAVTLSNAAPAGTCLTYVQSGAGQITFAAEAGGTLVNRQGHTKTAGQNAAVSLYVRSNSGTDAVWVLLGDTAA